jgi:soluble lytic murein transglycosylase-like protein
MQAIHNFSSLSVLQSGIQSELDLLELIDLRKLQALALTGALFLCSLPIAGQLDRPDTMALEDSHRDLSLAQVVERFQQRLPASQRVDAFLLGENLIRLSERHQISPGLILSVIETESSFRYRVVSKAGAVGLMQLLPSTAEEVARRYGIAYSSEEDLRNPIVNLELGVAYLAYLRGRFGNSVHYLAAYNMGPTALRGRMRRGNFQLGAISGYVVKVQERTLELRESSAPPAPSRYERQWLLQDGL